MLYIRRHIELPSRPCPFEPQFIHCTVLRSCACSTTSSPASAMNSLPLSVRPALLCCWHTYRAIETSARTVVASIRLPGAASCSRVKGHGGCCWRCGGRRGVLRSPPLKLRAQTPRARHKSRLQVCSLLSQRSHDADPSAPLCPTFPSRQGSNTNTLANTASLCQAHTQARITKLLLLRLSVSCHVMPTTICQP